MGVKREFSREEFEEILRLVASKVEASTSEQKVIRRRIRDDFKFYWSKLSNTRGGYTVEGVKNLVTTGIITISGSSNRIKLDEPVSRKKEIRTETIKKEREGVNIDDPFEKGDFRSIMELDRSILKKKGLYSLRLKPNSVLPKRYQTRFDEQGHRIIYIGKAQDQSLGDRLGQELYHKRAGTFFRSIGAVLEKEPIPGHLKGMSNQKNYKFSAEDTNDIINWLKENTEVCIVAHEGDFKVENNFIKKYAPILNHTHNPRKCIELIEDRARCRKIAIGS